MTAEVQDSYPVEINIFVKTPSGLKGHMKVSEVPSVKAPKLFLQLDAALTEKGFTADTGPSSATRSVQQKPKADGPPCEECGAATEYKTGKKKDGQPWKGWFCTGGTRGHPVKWVE